MVRRSESLSQGYRLTAASLPCPGCSFGTYGREDRGRTSGTTVAEGFRSWQKIPLRSITLETFCGAETTTQAGGSFFLYEKSVLRESDCLRGRKPEVSTDLTHPFSAPKKALKKLRVPRGFRSPMRRQRRITETRGQSPRGLPLQAHRNGETENALITLPGST